MPALFYDNNTRQRFIAHTADRYTTNAEQTSLVNSAFNGNPEFIRGVGYDAKARTFAANLVIHCEGSGDVDPNVPALYALRDALKQGVGVNLQRELDACFAEYVPESVNVRIPEPDDRFFDRTEVETVLQMLKGDRARVVLYGIAGVGKTQIALAVADRIGAQFGVPYEKRFFLNAATADTLLSSYRAVAADLRLGIRPDDTAARIAQVVADWFARNDGWFVLYDNADDPTIWHGISRISGRGRTLYTARTKAAVDIPNGFEIKTFDRETGTRYLLHLADRTAPDAAERAAAERIVKDMDCLALPLAVAGAYIRAVSKSVVRYANLYFEESRPLYDRLPANLPAEMRTMTRTVSLTLDHADRTDPPTALLLRILSYLAPDDLFYAMLRTNSEAYPGFLPESRPNLHREANDAVPWQERIAALERTGLVWRSGAGTTAEESDTDTEGALQMHRRTQEAIRATLPPGQEHGYIDAAATLCARITPEHDARYWATLERLLPHQEQVVEVARRTDTVMERVGLAAHCAAYYRLDKGNYGAARSLYGESLRIKKATLGEEHPDTATMLHQIARLEQAEGNYGAARSLYGESLRIKKATLGEEHPSTATTLWCLGDLSSHEGDWKTALQLTEQALAIYRAVFQEAHPTIADVYRYLSRLYQANGEAEKSKECAEKAEQVAAALRQRNTAEG